VSVGPSFVSFDILVSPSFLPFPPARRRSFASTIAVFFGLLAHKIQKETPLPVLKGKVCKDTFWTRYGKGHRGNPLVDSHADTQTETEKGCLGGTV